MTKVKICGITNLEDALAAADAGADALGFNFYKKSPRYVEPTKAPSIIDELSNDVETVGVFVNESLETLLKIVEISGVSAIQLHGDETHAFVTSLHRATSKEIIKAIRVSPDLDLAEVVDFDSHAILLDSFSKDEYGGSGRQFDWKIAQNISTMIGCLYLAGGISIENVGDAIRTVRPYGVDVCSSLESSPGKKDQRKVKMFIEAVRRADEF